jgi:hypothetical protein
MLITYMKLSLQEPLPWGLLWKKLILKSPKNPHWMSLMTEGDFTALRETFRLLVRSHEKHSVFVFTHTINTKTQINE